MDQSISRQFQSALIFLLDEKGRGEQSRLASQRNIDRGYLNAIIKGRKPGAEGVRLSIATHFDMIYEDMLALGRRILERKNAVGSEGREEIEQTNSTPSSGIRTKEGISESHVPQSNGEARSSISETILKVVEILESGTAYGDTLRRSIDDLHDAVSTKKENLALRNQILAMDSRITKLEEISSDKE